MEPSPVGVRGSCNEAQRVEPWARCWGENRKHSCSLPSHRRLQQEGPSQTTTGRLSPPWETHMPPLLFRGCAQKESMLLLTHKCFLLSRKVRMAIQCLYHFALDDRKLKAVLHHLELFIFSLLLSGILLPPGSRGSPQIVKP